MITKNQNNYAFCSTFHNFVKKVDLAPPFPKVD
jgi:hypothetical protein